MPKVIIARATLDQIQRSAPVVQALERKGERMLPRAQRLALAAGRVQFARSLRLEKGIRPGTKSPTGIRRAYVRVIAPAGADDEYGNRGVSRQDILRRSIGA